MNNGDVSFLFSTMDDVLVIRIHPQRVRGKGCVEQFKCFRLLQFYIKATRWLHLIPRVVDTRMYERRWVVDVLVVGLRLEELADEATEP